MSASQNNLSLILNQQDTDGVNILKRLVAATYAGAVGTFTDGLLTTTGATSQTLPKTTCLQYLFHNTHATAVVQVSWTPEAATGSVIASKVGPGGVLALWQGASGASGAFTAISLTTDTLNTTYEQFIGG